MRSLAVSLVLCALSAGPLFAQGRGRYGNPSQGVPPGQLPPAGMCRVWYDGVPPGRQPRPTSCNEAERIAARDRNARVIYGDNYGRNDRYGNTSPYGNRYPGNNRGGYGYNSQAYDNGYRDGLEKGREDARDGDSYDPVRHSRYRSGDHGYNSRYGTREQYRLAYRDGFEAGYDQAYRQNGGYRSPRRGVRLPWPF